MKATNDDYQKRSLDELEVEALKAMVAYGCAIRCGTMGEFMFRDVATLRGSAPFARIAGKVVRRLEAKGQAKYRFDKDFGGWQITNAGRKRLINVKNEFDHPS